MIGFFPEVQKLTLAVLNYYGQVPRRYLAADLPPETLLIQPRKVGSGPNHLAILAGGIVEILDFIADAVGGFLGAAVFEPDFFAVFHDPVEENGAVP